MSLRSRFIGAMRRGQNLSLAGSPMDALRKDQPGSLGTEEKSILIK
ncbi:MAG: hypothetical protein R6T98_07640 [Desulfatiglandales bacterium]